MTTKSDIPAADQGVGQPPERIWMVYQDDMEWTQIRVDGDFEYVRAEMLEDVARERDALREALKFYADERKYEGANSVADPDEESVAGYYRLDVTRDRGSKARTALTPKPE